MQDTEAKLDLKLAADVSAPAAARRRLDAVARYLHGHVFEDVLLLVNELVTNSVRHVGDGWIELKLLSSRERVRVEVHDSGDGFAPPADPPRLTETSGRGLYLVAVLADRWGVSMDGHTCVWFEIDAA